MTCPHRALSAVVPPTSVFLMPGHHRVLRSCRRRAFRRPPHSLLKSQLPFCCTFDGSWRPTTKCDATAMWLPYIPWSVCCPVGSCLFYGCRTPSERIGKPVTCMLKPYRFPRCTRRLRSPCRTVIELVGSNLLTQTTQRPRRVMLQTLHPPRITVRASMC